LGNQPRSFYPYGEQKSGPTATEQYAFATYWRDGESGLDYAMGRYYSSTDGRFLSPDPYGASGRRENPQTWNHYAYADNDPVNHNDPQGLTVVCYGPPDDPDCEDDYEGEETNPSAIQTGLSTGWPTGGKYGGLAGVANFLLNPKAVQAAIQNTFNRINTAVEAAINALLTDPNCAGLFSLDSDAPAPSALLAQIADGEDPQAYITTEFIGPDPQSPNTITNAEVTPTGYSLQNGQVTFTGIANNAVIVFNDFPNAPFNTGTVTQNAITLLHELGHVYSLLYGPGSTLIIDDSVQATGGAAQALAASTFNTNLVTTNCFPSGGR
jgi:RHS repeat-associated protein